MNPEIEKLRNELTETKTQLAQYQHRYQRRENKIAHLEKGERTKRTHRLITRGAAVESICKEISSLSETEFYTLMEQIFSLPEVKHLVSTKLQDCSEGGDF